MTISHRDALPEDGPALAAMATASFCETFAHLYKPADLDAFLTSASGPSALPAQIGDPAYRIRVALDGDRIVGFAKIAATNTLPAPAPVDAAELKQLYLLEGWKGIGISQALMEWAMAHARETGATQIVLSVYSENVRAQRFYARYGFVEIGENKFMVGDQADDDRIWMAPL